MAESDEEVEGRVIEIRDHESKPERQVIQVTSPLGGAELTVSQGKYHIGQIVHMRRIPGTQEFHITR